LDSIVGQFGSFGCQSDRKVRSEFDACSLIAAGEISVWCWSASQSFLGLFSDLIEEDQDGRDIIVGISCQSKFNHGVNAHSTKDILWQGIISLGCFPNNLDDVFIAQYIINTIGSKEEEVVFSCNGKSIDFWYTKDDVWVTAKSDIFCFKITESS